MARNRYLEEFVMLKSAPDLLAMKLYPNAKEITEAMGMFHAAVPGGQMKLCGLKHTALVIGDGNTPRLAAMLAFRTNWDVVSVDPRFKKFSWDKIDRLTTFVGTIEELGVVDCKGMPAILFYPHSHASFEAGVKAMANYSSLKLVAMPCCVPVPDSWMCRRHIAYRDKNVTSEKNMIHIWEATC